LSHFQNLLGKEARLPENYTLPSVKVSEALMIRTTKISQSELKVVIKQLKSSKAFGPDNIPAIIWKDEHFNSLLHHTFETYRSPKIWHKS